MGIKRTSHAVYDAYYHLVWCTKYRKPILRYKLGRECRAIFLKIARDYEWEIVELEVGVDHVHIFLGFQPRYSISKVVGILKSKSAGKIFRENPWIRKIYWGHEFWEDGYFARTVGDKITKDIIARYVRRHKEKKDIDGSSGGQFELF